MKFIHSTFIFVVIFTSLLLAQRSENRQRSFNKTMVITLGGGLSVGQTDYLESNYGLNARGGIEYIFPTSSRNIWGIGLYGGMQKISGKVNLVLAPTEYKTDIFSIGLGFSYNYAIENHYFPYISGGVSYIQFYPKVFDGKRNTKNELVILDDNKSSISFDSEIGLRILLSQTVSLKGGLSFHYVNTDNLDYLTVMGSNKDFYTSGFLGISFSLFTVKDSDGDGIYDDVDKCPDKPEDFDGFQDEDGCPDLDNDGDGIPDIRDKCPNKAEDFDGFQDDDGCPDLDNDGDGIPDIKDKCPDKPEDFDGFEDKDGCPDLDNDKDGILDKNDKCPDKPETFNGYQDKDGCPDSVPVVKVKKPKTKPKKKIKKTNTPKPNPLKNAPRQFLLHGETTFVGRTATIRPEAYSELKRIVKTLKKYPTSRWRIEGHMDNQGDPNQIRDISSRRARAILNYFVSKGLSSNRFKAVGMGDSIPISSNSTAYGRMRNRRIVIIRTN